MNCVCVCSVFLGMQVVVSMVVFMYVCVFVSVWYDLIVVGVDIVAVRMIYVVIVVCVSEYNESYLMK